MFKKLYTEQDIKELLKITPLRKGWDFSSMNTQRQPVPWDYMDIVALYLNSKDHVLDIGTGGGEKFIKLSPLFKSGIGIDIDPEMVIEAKKNGKETHNIAFYQDSDHLENTEDKFDVIINRHASFDLKAVFNHLRSGGYFITQQVGEKNMLNMKKALNIVSDTAICKEDIEKSGLKLLAFMEYNVQYIVNDVESLIFWLQALDMLHADFQGGKILNDVKLFNRMLMGNVDERGFITNEQRFLVIAQK